MPAGSTQCFGRAPCGRSWLMLIAGAGAAVASGCGVGARDANIELRKQNQSLQDQIGQLQRQRDGLAAQIASMNSKSHSTTITLPLTRLDQLFTTDGLSFGSLTGGYRPDPNAPADTMVKVYVAPTDEDGEPIKAAGSFTVQLFDLAQADTRLGTWNFPIEVARNDWYGRAFLYTYVLDCPWQVKPVHANLLLRVTFTDALTGRQFTQDKQITVAPPT